MVTFLAFLNQGKIVFGELTINIKLTLLKENFLESNHLDQ